MEEMLLRVCVVVASLLYIKDRTVFQEQEEKVLIDMQEREYLLQKEAAKLEQEMHQVTTGLPHSNQEVSQSHGRLTNAEGEDSGVQKVLANDKIENPHNHQMKDIQDEGVPLTHNNKPPELQQEVNMGENFPSEERPQPGIVSQNGINNVQEDDMSGHKKDIRDSDQKMETVNKEQIKDIQGQSPINGVKDNDQKSSQIDQVQGMRNQMPSEGDERMLVNTNTEELSTASDEQSTEISYNWYFWKFLSLISLIRLLRMFDNKGSQSSGTIIPIKNKTSSRPTGILSKTFIPDHQVLTSFYDQCVRVSPSTRGQVCEFVEGLVDDLLEAARDVSNKKTDFQIGDFIGVGSLYELWATGKTLVCDLYVPITAPRAHGFDVELWKEKDASLRSFGKIKMVKVENTSNGCPCMDGNPDDEDMLCLLHPHNERSTVMTNAVGGPLCQENTPYLSKKQVVRWFRSVILKTWREISHKYEFELGFCSQVAPGALRVRFRSGKIVLFNITPVVKIKNSEVYLLSYLSTSPNISDIHWPISFASYENALLKYFNKTLPNTSCHMSCLQILSFLHRHQTSLTGKCGLTSNHLKSTLLHLLMYKPTEWEQEKLTSRLTDMLTFLEQKLLAKDFHHALVGNSLVPVDIGLPKEFQTATPINIFLPMALDEESYLKTVQHFQELVKNTPVLIQEYSSIKSSA
ncbi:inositol 1,4,5-trisphosphate receptor-interacting protein [Tachysurus ichikawai]